MVWGKAGSTTLTSTSNTLNISGMTDNDTFTVLNNPIGTGNVVSQRVGYGSLDDQSNYAYRHCANFGTETVSSSAQTRGLWYNNAGVDQRFTVAWCVNLAGEEKLFIAIVNESTTTGNTAPEIIETVHKWTNTTNRFDNLGVVSTGGNAAYEINSNISALGSDITPAASIPFPTNVQVGSRAEIKDTRKIYYRDDIGWTELGEAPFNRKDSWYEHITGETP